MTIHIIFYVPYSIFSRQFGLPKPCILVVYVLVARKYRLSTLVPYYGGKSPETHRVSPMLKHWYHTQVGRWAVVSATNMYIKPVALVDSSFDHDNTVPFRLIRPVTRHRVFCPARIWPMSRVTLTLVACDNWFKKTALKWKKISSLWAHTENLRSKHILFNCGS